MVISTKYGNMNVMLDRGSFMPDKADDPGEVYYIRAPKSIRIDPHNSCCTIDTGIYVDLPDGYRGYLRLITGLSIHTLIDETRIDGTGNKSILVTIRYYGDIGYYYIHKGDIIAKLVIRPFKYSYTPENDKDIIKANSIEIRRAHSGRLYLIFYDAKDDSFILGDDGYSVKISRDIVESLELVDIPHTMKELEYFLESTRAQNNERL